MADKLQGGVKDGSTSFSVNFMLRKTADNTEQTGKVAADMTGSYQLQGGNRVSISLSDLAAVNSAYSSGGVKEIDSTNMKGLYRLDLPNAALTGADWVTVSIQVTGCYTWVERFPITTNVIQTVAQTGDSYARIGAAGVSLSAIPDLAGVTTLLARLTSARGGYLDLLNTYLDATISSRTKPADTQARVTLVDTLTTYTGNTPQTGDAYAVLAAHINKTTIATLSSQTSFTLTAGSANNGAYVGWLAVVTNASTATQKALGLVSAYTGASKTVTLATDPSIFTMAAGDTIILIAFPVVAAATDIVTGGAITTSGGKVSNVATVDSVTALAAAAIAEAAFAADTAKYQMKCQLAHDNAGTTDLYLVTFFKNGQPITSGITSMTIQVVKASDGTDLIASTALTQIASTGYFKKSEGTNRITAGSGYIAKISASIDSGTRTWSQPVSRDTA